MDVSANMTTGDMELIGDMVIDATLGWLRQCILCLRITLLWIYVISVFFACIITSLARTIITHFPTHTVLALLRWIIATSRVPELLGIKPDNQDCMSSYCIICLVDILLLGTLTIFALRYVIETTRLPTFQRSVKNYAIIYFMIVGGPGLLLATLWWSCYGEQTWLEGRCA